MISIQLLIVSVGLGVNHLSQLLTAIGFGTSRSQQLCFFRGTSSKHCLCSIFKRWIDWLLLFCRWVPTSEVYFSSSLEGYYPMRCIYLFKMAVGSLSRLYYWFIFWPIILREITLLVAILCFSLPCFYIETY